MPTHGGQNAEDGTIVPGGGPGGSGVAGGNGVGFIVQSEVEVGVGSAVGTGGSGVGAGENGADDVEGEPVGALDECGT